MSHFSPTVRFMPYSRNPRCNLSAPGRIKQGKEDLFFNDPDNNERVTGLSITGITFEYKSFKNKSGFNPAA